MSKLLKQINYQIRYILPLWFVQLVTNWLPENQITIRLRGLLVKPFLGKCGRNLQLARNITFLNPAGIKIADDVYIATGCWLDGIGGLEIEEQVELSPFVVVTTSSHCFKDNSVRFGGSCLGSVKIKRGSWIASHSVVVSGTEIGAGAIIGANSVVSKNIPNKVFAGGVPAKVISQRKDKKADLFSRFDKDEE